MSLTWKPSDREVSRALSIIEREGEPIEFWKLDRVIQLYLGTVLVIGGALLLWGGILLGRGIDRVVERLMK